MEHTSTNMSQGSSNIGLLVVGALGAGALLMYLFDPDRGRGRRARLRDQLMSKTNRVTRTAGSKARDLRNRMQGVVHELGAFGSKRKESISMMQGGI